MSSATITIPDDLDAELDELARERNVTPAEAVELVLRQYFVDRQRWGGRQYRPAARPFEITPLDEIDEKGEPDVSVNHDRYLTEE